MKIRIVEATLRVVFQVEVDKLRRGGWTPLWETFQVATTRNDMYYVVVMEKMELDVGEGYTQEELERDIEHDEVAAESDAKVMRKAWEG